MKRNLAANLAWAFSAGFVIATVMGFIPNPLVGENALFVTNTAHNLVHLATAIGFAVVAFISNRASTRFMLAFGAVYTLVGLVGFAVLGGAAETHLLGIIHINFLDNFLHVGLGIAIAVAGSIALRKEQQDAKGLNGYDPVAYFTDGQPTRGSASFTSDQDGRRYYFASEQHKRLFDEEPEKYLPQYGGYCAFGVSMGQLFDVDPETGQVLDGKLYLNLNQDILTDFNKDAPGYIRQADEQWPTIAAAA